MEDDGECLKPDINRYGDFINVIVSIFIDRTELCLSIETWVLLLGSAGFIISVLALPVAGLMIYGVMKVRFLFLQVESA